MILFSLHPFSRAHTVPHIKRPDVGCCGEKINYCLHSHPASFSCTNVPIVFQKCIVRHGEREKREKMEKRKRWAKEEIRGLGFSIFSSHHRWLWWWHWLFLVFVYSLLSVFCSDYRNNQKPKRNLFPLFFLWLSFRHSKTYCNLRFFHSVYINCI